jgi:hypothetical protein
MSHIVTVQTKLRDLAAIAAACQRLGLAAPTQGTACLFSAEVTGVLVQLPDWQYPMVIDTSSGEVRYDTYEGRWGEETHLHRFLQAYAVERAKREAQHKGYAFSEQQLQDGSIRLEIREGA